MSRAGSGLPLAVSGFKLHGGWFQPHRRSPAGAVRPFFCHTAAKFRTSPHLSQLPLPPPNPRMSKKILYDLAILAAVIALGGLGYTLAPLLTPQSDVAAPLADCDLNAGPCRTDIPGGGSLEFSISPHPVPALKPLTLEARISGIEARKVEVDFTGIDMKMGFNRPVLSPGNAPGRFTGQGNLPVCITGTMTWQATVLVESGGRSIAVPFRFSSGVPDAH